MHRLQRILARWFDRLRPAPVEPTPVDTYGYLLDNPRARSFALCGQALEHRAAGFSRRVYEASRGVRFPTREAAHADWLRTGRSQGLAFARGKDTYLKIVLKVRDEPDLIPRWLAYHGRIVGLHNIIVMDCGSSDPAHLAVLRRYRDKILILGYPHYYDRLHVTDVNPDFYDLLAANCRYVCILDADEFLIGHRSGTIGPANVLPVIRDGGEEVYAGTWFPNLTAPARHPGGGLDWTVPLRFDIAPDAIVAGTFSGKAVVRADLSRTLGHVGHNLHVPAVAARMRPGSFGRIGVLHVSRQTPAVARARSLKHLRAMAVVPPELLAEEAIAAHLARLDAQHLLDDLARRYAAPYLGPEQPEAKTDASFVTRVLEHGRTEANPNFVRALAGFDFGRFL